MGCLIPSGRPRTETPLWAEETTPPAGCGTGAPGIRKVSWKKVDVGCSVILDKRQRVSKEKGYPRSKMIDEYMFI